MTERAAAPVLVDQMEMRLARDRRMIAIARWVLPFVSLGLLIAAWQWAIIAFDMKPYILSPPLAVADALWTDFMKDFGPGLLNLVPRWLLPLPEAVLSRQSLVPSLFNTLETTLKALAVAITGGVGLAILFTQSRWIEMVFSPYAVILQVTPIVVVAPYITIYIESVETQLLVCASIVAFFPVLSNTTLGLHSTDHNLRNLFELYGASRWQTLVYLRLPGALPYFLGGLRIAGGLALIGAVVAEFVVGASGKGSGLAFRILEAAYRLNISRMLAATVLISCTGILMFVATSWLTWFLLHRWHESALKREN